MRRIPRHDPQLETLQEERDDLRIQLSLLVDRGDSGPPMQELVSRLNDIDDQLRRLMVKRYR